MLNKIHLKIHLGQVEDGNLHVHVHIPETTFTMQLTLLFQGHNGIKTRRYMTEMINVHVFKFTINSI